MIRLIIGFVILVLPGCSPEAVEQNEIAFHFDEKGEFKIAQFSDLHLGDKNQKLFDETLDVVKEVLQAEKPDLAVITGDVVTTAPIKEGWLAIAKVFEAAKTPWAVTLGNHDGRDAGTTRDEVFHNIARLPYYVGKKGEDISGVGNYIIPLNHRDTQKAAALLYFMDSHNRPFDRMYGQWDWIKNDQIQWYRKSSRAFRSDNNYQKLPSLIFFHIPLPEFKEITGGLNTVGTKGEGVSSPEINSGLFSAFVEQDDMLGVFAGHDHDNDYIGIHYGIALSFCRATGIEAYGNLERGSRIIQLFENKCKFDSWIRTRHGRELFYYYPSGISSKDETERPFIQAGKDLKKRENGLSYSYFEGGRFKKSSDLREKGKLIKEGVVRNFTLEHALASDSIGFIFKGNIDIPEDGVYRFYTYSDDGSLLFIDDKIVVDNDGSHNAMRVDGKIGLKAGPHTIKVIYFQDYMGKTLEVGWASRDIEEEKIPDGVLYLSHEE